MLNDKTERVMERFADGLAETGIDLIGLRKIDWYNLNRNAEWGCGWSEPIYHEGEPTVAICPEVAMGSFSGMTDTEIDTIIDAAVAFSVAVQAHWDNADSEERIDRACLDMIDEQGAQYSLLTQFQMEHTEMEVS